VDVDLDGCDRGPPLHNLESNGGGNALDTATVNGVAVTVAPESMGTDLLSLVFGGDSSLAIAVTVILSRSLRSLVCAPWAMLNCAHNPTNQRR
jgi:hypothetical protein